MQNAEMGSGIDWKRLTRRTVGHYGKGQAKANGMIQGSTSALFDRLRGLPQTS